MRDLRTRNANPLPLYRIPRLPIAGWNIGVHTIIIIPRWERALCLCCRCQRHHPSINKGAVNHHVYAHCHILPSLHTFACFSHPNSQQPTLAISQNDLHHVDNARPPLPVHNQAPHPATTVSPNAHNTIIRIRKSESCDSTNVCTDKHFDDGAFVLHTPLTKMAFPWLPSLILRRVRPKVSYGCCWNGLDRHSIQHITINNILGLVGRWAIGYMQSMYEMYPSNIC